MMKKIRKKVSKVFNPGKNNELLSEGKIIPKEVSKETKPTKIDHDSVVELTVKARYPKLKR